MRHSPHVIDEAKKAIASPQNPENQSRLAQAVSQALNQVINCLPGQRDVDAAIKEIAAASVALTTGQYPPAGDMSLQDVVERQRERIGGEFARDVHAIGASVEEIIRIGGKQYPRKASWPPPPPPGAPVKCQVTKTRSVWRDGTFLCVCHVLYLFLAVLREEVFRISARSSRRSMIDARMSRSHPVSAERRGTPIRT